MRINVNDLVALHYINGKSENKCIPPNYSTEGRYFNENMGDIKESLAKLHKKDLIYLESDIEKGLEVLNKDELKEILKDIKVPSAARKNTLINKIIENIQLGNIDTESLQIPKFYKLSDEGLDIINNTSYIPYFLDNWFNIITLNRAHKYAKEISNEEDKIEKIHIKELKRRIQSDSKELLDYPIELTSVLNSLINYEFQQKNIEKSRISANLVTFLEFHTQVKQFKKHIDSEFFDEEYDIPKFYIEDTGKIRGIYEILILNQETPIEDFIDWFIDDLSYLFEVNTEYFSDIAKYI
ncbi:hypothetical protein CD127_10285, partial [Staphylococcus petrasii]